LQWRGATQAVSAQAAAETPKMMMLIANIVISIGLFISADAKRG